MIKKLLIKSFFTITWIGMAYLSAISGHDYYIGMKACEINYGLYEENKGREEKINCVKGVTWHPEVIQKMAGIK